ncbi:hypothetical protein [Falsirhodobacter sp. 1013]|uniref:hypothetical protein n=1 Tax=Falsirhodobacter sp. 1013 TaxID=3417566 RepID=UPI003EB9D2E5
MTVTTRSNPLSFTSVRLPETRKNTTGNRIGERANKDGAPDALPVLKEHLCPIHGFPL